MKRLNIVIEDYYVPGLYEIMSADELMKRKNNEIIETGKWLADKITPLYDTERTVHAEN